MLVKDKDRILFQSWQSTSIVSEGKKNKNYCTVNTPEAMLWSLQDKVGKQVTFP